jgi:competence ComEA-like helix-hairpin-helix protein
MPQAEDWTLGPAKWAAVLVLGGASIFGIAWSVLTRTPGRPTPVAAGPAVPSEDEPNLDPRAAAAPAPPSAATAVPEQPAAVHRVNLNTATAAELELLPGIGPALAARIVEHRTANGAFKSVEQLDDVKGIGPRTLERLRHLVRVE